MTKILIIKMWALGDILMATPMLNAIRAKEPDAHITWLADSFHAAILENHPLIDDLIALDSGAWRRLMRKGRIWAWVARTRELNQDIRTRNFDIIINCQPDKYWTRFLCPAPKTVGLFPSRTVPPSGRFYTHALPKPKGLHNTENFLQATAAAGFPPASRKMSLGETPDERGFIEEFRSRNGLETDCPTVVLAPFSTAENRSFNIEFAARIVDWLHAEVGAQVVVVGGPGDVERSRRLGDTAKAPIIVAEGTTLRQFVALIRHAGLVITGDSSPMHLAAAVDTPYVALFGPTPVEERAPLEGKGVVLVKPIPCAPCDVPTCGNRVFQECMKLIGLTDVQDAVTRLLTTRRNGGPIANF